jgi:hypothetical protein
LQIRVQRFESAPGLHFAYTRQLTQLPNELFVYK